MLFNSFFANQCTLINNMSVLPPFECKVNSKIDNVIFTEHDILSIIRSLNSNKAHGWDDISIRMVKMCDESIAYPLKIIFETALKSGIYPDKWKKANVFRWIFFLLKVHKIALLMVPNTSFYKFCPDWPCF